MSDNKLEIFPAGKAGFYFLGTRLVIATANGKEKAMVIRDERFSPVLHLYEAEWLLRNEGNEKGKTPPTWMRGFM